MTSMCPRCKTVTHRDGKTDGKGGLVYNCLNCGERWDLIYEPPAKEEPVAPPPAPTPPTPPTPPTSMTLAHLEGELRFRGARITDAEIVRDGRFSVGLECRGIKVWSPADSLEAAVVLGLQILDRCIAAAREVVR